MTSTKQPRRYDPRLLRKAPEWLLVDLILRLAPKARDQILTFMHLAEEPDRVQIHVEATEDKGLRMILTYPAAED